MQSESQLSRRGLLGLSAGAALGVGLAGCASSQATRTPPQRSPSQVTSTDVATASASVGDSGVSFHVAGEVFRPVVELMSSSRAIVKWLDGDGHELAIGSKPKIELDQADPTNPHTVVMQTTFSDVVTLNLGFNQADDAGRYSLDASHNKDAEPVVAVSGLTLMGNLRNFMAANSPLTGALDLSGLSSLEYVECFNSSIQQVDLRGCTGLVRLCLEANQLRHLDLNPVATTIRDLRAAAQQGGSLALEPLAGPLSRLYHFCVRDQEVIGHPTADQLPECEELLNWNTKQVGVVPTPPMVSTLASAGNAYTTADFAGLWTKANPPGELDLRDSKLITISLKGCRGLRTIRLDGNSLNRRDVDALLGEVAAWETEDGVLSLTGSAIATPSTRSSHHVAALRERGWDVNVNRA